MKTRHLRILALVVAAGACTDVPIDDSRNDKRLFPPRGVIRGTVSFVGPRPCSKDGHIVGSAIVLVFDRRNPPPPNGFATSAANFVAVPGDVLFANEPRYLGPELSCPDESEQIEATAPFTIAPLDPASYIAVAFYDRRGRFLPTFKFRNLPELGDIAGGYIDVDDAQKNAQNVGYEPTYKAIDVGVPQPADEGVIPDFTMPASGYVADNVPVSLGRVVPFTRPYFYPRYIDPATNVATTPDELGNPTASPANPTGDALAVPLLTMTQDVHILAPPQTPTTNDALTKYQQAFPSLQVVWGVAPSEVGIATDPAQPFGFQLPALPPSGKGGLLVFARGGSIPESAAMPALWPRIALVKLVDDPTRTHDPQSLVVQGTTEETFITGKAPGPVVVIEGITLLDDSIGATIAGGAATTPTTNALHDHVTALVRPSALCFFPGRIDLGALLVTPYFTGTTAGGSADAPLFDRAAIAKGPVREVRRGCLPTGRYAITLVYPTGQAWTVPNESGGCAPAEGGMFLSDSPPVCTAKPRPVLLSQGARGVVEITGPSQDGINAGICDEFPVPTECSPP